MNDPQSELTIARKQLEAALSRRTELLEQRTAVLANIHAGKAFQFANTVQKLTMRFFPLHTRRRAALRSSLEDGDGGGRVGARQAGGTERPDIGATAPDGIGTAVEVPRAKP